MNDIAISVKDLSKRFRLGARQERYKTLRETLMEAFFRPFRALKKTRSKTRNADMETIWALKDISFEIKRGEAVGIIGRNGAGKSTLLKILSRITEPTTGYAEIFGRVGSLLEVGTGFHSELSGRDNIYLNGTILGMKRNEIDRKFDEIVSFAEVERFIDTPVKHYSSGMYLRLAFAVAAHLEPEILIVDEVLAVGDAQFQKRCLRKMGTVAKEGRTVLFVSHNMGAVSTLCSQTLLLESGRLSCIGETNSIIHRYYQSQRNALDSGATLVEKSDIRNPEKEIVFESAWIESTSGERKFQFEMEEPFSICFTYRVRKPVSHILIAAMIETMSGDIVIDTWDSDSLKDEEPALGLYTVKVRMDHQDLHPGIYQISLRAVVHLIRWIDRVPAAVEVEILPVGKGRVWRSERKAIVARILQWERSYEQKLPASG